MAKIRKYMNSKISNGMITWILNKVGIWHWRSKRRLYLTDDVVGKGLLDALLGKIGLF